MRTNSFEEFGGRSWIAVWQEWIADLDRSLSAKGIPLIPNVGGLATTWDNSDYSLTAGVFCEGFLDPQFTTADWKAAADQTLELVRREKIVILQNYLSSPDDVSRRRFLLASYLLVKGSRTYVAYFASNTFQWYPEWDLDLGRAQQTGVKISDLGWNGIYRRNYEKGVVLVNPGTMPVRVSLGATLKRVVLRGGGDISRDAKVTGRTEVVEVRDLELGPKDAEILLR